MSNLSAKRSNPAKTAELCTFRHITQSGTVTDNEESSINANKKLAMGFPTRHQPRLCVIRHFPKIGYRYSNLTFFA